MPDEPEVIRQQMEETRADLAAKLETLEQHVVNTVTGTTAAVSETVENVKEAVQETVDAVKGSVQSGVESVKNAFDVSAQVDRHPWFFMAGSVALGFWGGLFVQQSQRRSRTSGRSAANGYSSRSSMASQSASGLSQGLTSDGAPNSFAQTSATEAHAGGLLSSLASEFSGELNKLKAVAVGTGFGLVRDLVAQSLPESLKPRVSEIVDNVTKKLGGEVVEGPIWQGQTAPQGSQSSSYQAEGTMSGAYRQGSGTCGTSHMR